ncbi:MAG: hypothetical protein GY749_33120 [Desulfobacteraceae bacterium]|nr:hypothetical protein [Desulfobacteraceae bacterium]
MEDSPAGICSPAEFNGLTQTVYGDLHGSAKDKRQRSFASAAKNRFACLLHSFPDNLLIIQGKQKSCQTLHAIALQL